eukprot:s2323_g11.t1
MATGTPMASIPEEPTEQLASQHKLKLKPPTYDGNYTTFEEWKYKFSAYMGLQDPFYPRMLDKAATANQHLAEADLRGAATTPEEGDKWIQLDQNLKYILINVTTGAAATICRQYQHEIGLEIYRKLCDRFSIPTGTRSIGYLTKLLKPTFDTNNFEESFSNWEFELNRYERDNTTQLPDSIKIAILMNETTGQLQQHLHLNAGMTTTYNEVRNIIMEYYRTATAFTRLQQQQPSSSVSTNFQGGPAPMDISTLHNKGKHKGKHKGKGKWKGAYKGKGKGNKGKGYGYGNTSYNNQGYPGYTTGKGKGKIGQGMPFKGMSNKGYKGKGKQLNKGKAATQGCYRCGQQGHIARDCRVGVYHFNDAGNNANNEAYSDATEQWYQQQHSYDNYWWNSDQTTVNTIPQQQPQLALPSPIPQQDTVPTLHIGAIRAATCTSNNASIPNLQQVPDEDELMIDSGAATHVCPVWFAMQQPTYDLHPSQAPQLRTATEDPIPVHGYKWVYMKTDKQQPMVIPFYVCDVSQPILSVTRLAEQGFNITLSEHPTMTNNNGFEATLKQKEGLYFLPVKVTTVPRTERLDVHDTPDGIKATISPVTLTPQGAQWVTHNNDIWMYNSQGYLVRVHKRQRRALYTPDQQCPVPEDKLENYRRTIVHKADGTTEDIVEQYKDLTKPMKGRRLPGSTWSGETWFQVKPNIKPPPPPLPKVTPKKHEQQRQTTPKQGTMKQQTAQQNKPQQQEQPGVPTKRYTSKQPQETATQQFPATAVPKPQDVATTGDYWIKEGNYWKRVHNIPRTDLYIPQQTHDGPDVTLLLPTRQTIVKPTSGARGYRIDDDWTTKTYAKLNHEWIGSTNFEVGTSYKDEYYEDQEEEQQQATKAKGIKAPAQPTPQERAEHELTHLPYRSWCPTCVQSKGRSDNHPKQQSRSPVVQFDFCFFKAHGETKTSTVLTGIDVQTGMCTAVLITDKQKDFQHNVQSIQAFLLECGRVQAVLNSTVLQTDQEDHLIALLKATASRMGGNISVRQAPAYSPQSQGSVERFHRTLMGQVRALKPMRRQAEASATQTEEQQTSTEAAPRPSASAPAAASLLPPTATTPAIADAPMATSPTSCHSRPTMPSPPKRTVSDAPSEGSLPKQPRTAEETTGPPRPATTVEPPTTRLRLNKITIKAKNGDEITAYSCEDATEQHNERILLEPIVNNTEGFDKEKTIEGMKQEILSMKKQQVYIEVNIDTLTPEQRSNIIQSRWVLRDKGNNVRARIVAKGYTEVVTDLDAIYASTPIFCVLRTLLAISCNNGWIVKTGDISTAFLHASAATQDLHMYPPREFYDPTDRIVWKLNKAIYGLRSSPSAWQKHLAEVLQQLGLIRNAAEPNIYMTPTRDCYILVYVDDLLFLGQQPTVDKLFTQIQQHLLLRPTGTLTPGNTVSFLGRNITNKGNYYEISLPEEYTTRLLEEKQHVNMQPSISTRDGFPEISSNSRPRAASLNRRARSFSQSSWQATMDDVHTS